MTDQTVWIVYGKSDAPIGVGLSIQDAKEIALSKTPIDPSHFHWYVSAGWFICGAVNDGQTVLFTIRHFSLDNEIVVRKQELIYADPVNPNGEPALSDAIG